MIDFLFRIPVPLVIGGILLIPAFRNLRHFREGRNKPIIPVADYDRLSSIPCYWPLSSRRWPPPWENDDKPMRAEVAKAYSRLAERMAGGLNISAELMVVIGGAWLGVNLPGIVSDYRSIVAAESSRLAQPELSHLWVGLSFHTAGQILPLAAIALGAMFRGAGRRYIQASHSYKNVVDAQSIQLVVTPRQVETAGFVRRLVRWFMS